MIFLNYTRLADGSKLERGMRCNYREFQGTYMGSCIEAEKTRHMLLIDEMYNTNGEVTIPETLHLIYDTKDLKQVYNEDTATSCTVRSSMQV